ncbi:MAG: LacI family DNA-binding transcriptional regulator [Candidatus Omnitrophica bacterium]|nr:LacI family DNA-binding transcriptional regulator [Candidatus Omnitrophota bacterium]
MRNSSKPVGIEDVARRAHVSITTVSRVINHVPTVHPKNIERVEEAIAALHYKPNVSAQRLASGVTKAIGLVMPGYPGIFYSFYAVELMRGVGHGCESLQLDMVFHITNGSNPLKSNSVGGIVFADVIENRNQVDAALEAGLPCVIVNNHLKDVETHYIALDNLLGGRMAAEYLTGLRHRRIATITGNVKTQAGAERLEGFAKYLKSKNIPLPEQYIYPGDYSRQSARRAMEQFLKLPERPTAIFAASDDMALEALAVLAENGLKAPRDISLIGFDDNPACLNAPVALTTLHQPLFRMAEEAVRLLHSIMQGKTKKIVRKMIAPSLIVRESTAPYVPIQNSKEGHK